MENTPEVKIDNTLLKSELKSLKRTSIIGGLIIIFGITTILIFNQNSVEFLYWHLFVSRENIRSIDKYKKMFKNGKFSDAILISEEAYIKYFQSENICKYEIKWYYNNTNEILKCDGKLSNTEVKIVSVDINKEIGEAFIKFRISANCERNYSEKDDELYDSQSLRYRTVDAYNQICFSCNKWEYIENK